MSRGIRLAYGWTLAPVWLSSGLSPFRKYACQAHKKREIPLFLMFEITIRQQTRQDDAIPDYANLHQLLQQLSLFFLH